MRLFGFASDVSLFQPKQKVVLIYKYLCSSLASVFMFKKIDPN